MTRTEWEERLGRVIRRLGDGGLAALDPALWPALAGELLILARWVEDAVQAREPATEARP
jgi:hypothetical protein